MFCVCVGVQRQVYAKDREDEVLGRGIVRVRHPNPINEVEGMDDKRRQLFTAPPKSILPQNQEGESP